jgi:hypothetical protein
MAEELSDQIEAAEEAEDSTKLLGIIETCTLHGGDEDWTEVAESSLDAYFRLAKSGKANGDDKGIPAVFAALAAWNEEAAIVEVALGCIVALAKTYSGNTNNNVDLSLLWTMIKSFPDESTIQEQACLAIEGLALASDSCKAALKASDGIELELAAAKERITNERNKAYPGRAAEALGISL